MVQAWYQGGISVFDFTDPAKPVEIAYFDRGPVDPAKLTLGGFWSAYWYNGQIYGSEIGRGFDVLRLTPSEHITQNELDAAGLVRFAEFNPQLQTKLAWPAHVSVARAYLDQLARGNGLAAASVASARRDLDRADRLEGRRPPHRLRAARHPSRRRGRRRRRLGEGDGTGGVVRELGVGTR
jgi:hypothetical protein